MAEIVERLSARIDETIDPILAPRVGRRLFLLDVPDHANVGDQAIFLGELSYLRRRFPKTDIVLASFTTFRAIADQIKPDDVIALHGGGNFGDIWPQHHQFRLKILRRYKDNVILQFPQSISFAATGSFDDTRAAIAGCREIHFLTRDVKAEAFASQNFDCSSYLCPDMAFAMGPLRPHSPKLDAVALLRTDKEVLVDKTADLHAALDTARLNYEVLDWLGGDTVMRRLYITPSNRLAKAGIPGSFSTSFTNFAFERYAKARLAVGVEMLSRGKVVITDRLHGQIITTLLGRPLYVFDSLDGKISAFRKTWLEGDPKNTVVTSVAELADHLATRPKAAA